MKPKRGSTFATGERSTMEIGGRFWRMNEQNFPATNVNNFEMIATTIYNPLLGIYTWYLNWTLLLGEIDSALAKRTLKY